MQIFLTAEKGVKILTFRWNIFMFIDISSDYIHLTNFPDNQEDHKEQKTISLPRNGIENVLWAELIKRQKAYSFTQAYILNWPGGFTNLRVGTLCLNLLNTLLDRQLDFFSVSKPELYQFAYDAGELPRFGVIYIGQKRNIRLRDFQERKKIWQMNFDELAPRISWNLHAPSSELFLDVTTDPEYYPDFLSSCTKVSYAQIQSRMATYCTATHPAPMKTIEAKYMIDPIITPPRSGRL